MIEALGLTFAIVVLSMVLAVLWYLNKVQKSKIYFDKVKGEFEAKVKGHLPFCQFHDKEMVSFLDEINYSYIRAQQPLAPSEENDITRIRYGRTLIYVKENDAGPLHYAFKKYQNDKRIEDRERAKEFWK